MRAGPVIQANHLARCGGALLVALAAATPSAGGQCQTASLLATDPHDDDWFGRKVALDGLRAAVSAFKDDESGLDAGAVYAFGRDGPGGVWGPAVKMLASDGGAGDQFGFALALCGGHLIAGANQEDERGSNAGAAYVYELQTRAGGPVWTEVAKLTAFDGADDDRFGTAVGIDGDIAVVGSYQDDDAGNNSGSVYVFQRDALGAWTFAQKLQGSDAAAEDKFGFAASIHGDVVVVGAYQKADPALFTGAAYVFARVQGTWAEVARLGASDAGANQLFGVSVDVHGDTAVIGASGSAPGAAYVFSRDAGGPGVWGEVKKLLASDAAPGDQFGSAVSISGDVLVVGARLDDDGGNATGSAYLFGRDQGGRGFWGELGKLHAEDAMPLDLFANDVSIDGAHVLAGAHRNDEAGDNAGAAYVFNLVGGCSPGCPDVDDDGAVDVQDLIAVLLAWGGSDPAADVNDDGAVNVDDLIAVLLAWGPC